MAAAVLRRRPEVHSEPPPPSPSPQGGGSGTVAAIRRTGAARAKPLFRRRFEIDCTVDVEHTTESLHAYVFLDGYEVGPGDEVTVKNPPATPAFGGRVVRRCRASVTQAGLWGRIWTPVAAYLELTDLYEVGFDERSAS